MESDGKKPPRLIPDVSLSGSEAFQVSKQSKTMNKESRMDEFAKLEYQTLRKEMKNRNNGFS